MSAVNLNIHGGHEPESFSLEVELERIEALLKGDYAVSRRSIALLALQEDADILSLVEKNDAGTFSDIKARIEHVKKHYAKPLDYVIASRRQEEASHIIKRVWRSGKDDGNSFAESLSRLTVHPLTGLPILFLILYWGLYKFVGGFGAGTLVDFLEKKVFDQHVNPFLVDVFTRLVPWAVLRDLFVGEYGVLTLGLRYAIGIILPIVAVFFVFFAVIEDTGYLPRLSLLIDRLFKKLGLSGRAVIPMVLGFGCSTMATMVTRTLPTKRERVIATLLLALAVPCSAQLGVILALLGGRPLAFGIWTLVMVAVFLLIGFLAARVLPGERPSFYMEVPPLRLPKLSNVVVKTLSRVWWYLQEVLPLFFAASVIIWLMQITKFFDLVTALLKKPVALMGLPEAAAPVFLFGFFRRDYGAAGLYDLEHAGALTGVQLVTACVALALFLPCIAQFLMNVKERGWKTGLGISIFILFFSFSVATLVNWILVNSGVVL
jgi:ferrous iron transport protein B